MSVPLFKKIQSRWNAMAQRLPFVKGKQPDFLIIGAQKAGTTSLFNYLGQHPDIHLPVAKEIHYYDLHYSKGINWYKRFFRANRGAQITGESTPYYLFHPLVPERVYRDNPQTKIIVLLRNPGERAFSHYQMIKRMGIEKLATFSEALEAELTRFKKGLKYLIDHPYKGSVEHQHYTYLSRGKYERQLRRWFRYFPREQMLILKAEDLFANPVKTLEKVYRFLQIANIYPEDMTAMNQGSQEQMNPSEKELLDNYFNKYNQKLEALLGTKFNWEGADDE